MIDTLTRYVLAACFALFLAVLGIGAALGPAGCTKNTRKDTIVVLLTTVNASRDAFTTWDLAHQRAILAAATSRDEYKAKIETYREKQAKVLLAFKTVYDLIDRANKQVDDPSIKKAREASNRLLEDVKDVMGAGPDVVDPVQIITVPEPGAPRSPPATIPADAGAP